MSEWQTKRLGDVLQLNYGRSLPLKSRVEGAIPVYGSNGIVGSHNEPIVDKPGLIVGRKGSAGEVHFSRGPFCPIDTTFYVTEDDAPDTDLEFLFYLLRHVDLTRITGDVGVPGLNREVAYMEPVRFPSELPEQKKIAHILSTVQRAIEAQERIIQTTTELKKALMHKLFTEGLRGEPQKQTEIGLVPESWDVVALGSESPRLLTVMRNGYTGKQTADPQRFSVSRIETIGAGFIDLNRVRYAVDPTSDVIEKYLLRRGDILFSHINSDPHLGKTGIADQDSGELLHGMNLLLIRSNPALLDPWFLNFVFQWYRERGIFIAICSRAVNQSSINQGQLNALEIPLPSPVEQKEIAAAFLSLDQKIAYHQRKRCLLQDLFRTLLHELMTGKVRVSDLEMPLPNRIMI